MKSKMHYFKIAFILSVPIAVFVIVYGLFEVDFSDSSQIMILIAKGVFTGLFTGLILGLINIFAKVDSLFVNKKTKE